jgi:predicted secreted protein
MNRHVQIRMKMKFSKLFPFVLLFLSIIFPMIYQTSSIFAAETVVVNKQFNQREIKVKIGGSIRVELEELGSAGYTWKLQKQDEFYLSSPKVENKGTPPKDDITGAPVLKTWTFQAKKAGQTELKFIYFRPWEDEKTASDTYVLKVRIVP